MIPVEEEIKRLQKEITRLGKRDAKDNKVKVAYGVLFNDDKVANTFEALLGTLKAAKKRKVVSYDGEILLKGVHDNVEIILLQE
jgi:hypothetical protein